jgi:hypothetical protein
MKLMVKNRMKKRSTRTKSQAKTPLEEETAVKVRTMKRWAMVKTTKTVLAIYPRHQR